MSPVDEKDLAAALRRQADRMGVHPLGLAEVKGSARGIQRRRRAVTGVVAAVALAVALPVGLSVVPSLDDSAPPPANPSPAPSPTVDAEPVGQVGFDVNAAPAGPAPRISYLLDGAVVTAADTPVTLGGGTDYRDFAALGDGWVATDYGDAAQPRVRVLDAAGSPVGEALPADGNGSLAVSPDDTLVAFVEEGGGVAVLGDGGERQGLPRPREGNQLDAAAVLGSSTCADPSPCSVFVNDGSNLTQAWVVNAQGGTRVQGVEVVNDVAADGRIAARTESREDLSTCSMVGTNAGGMLWETCDHRLVSFSPDGTKVLAVQSEGSGLGDPLVAILDAEDGEVLVEYVADASTQTFAVDLAWEDDEHVLAVTLQRTAWQIARLGLDGTIEQTVDPVENVDESSPFHLETR